MKNYFGFTLTGKKLLPFWMLMYGSILALYFVLFFVMRQSPFGASHAGIMPLILLLLMLLVYSLSFFLIKPILNHIRYKEEALSFDGTFGRFFGVLIGGMLLTIITLGVYLAWYIRNVFRFFVDNTTLKGDAFSFKGTGGRLFLILLLSMVLPIALFSVVVVSMQAMHASSELLVAGSVIYQLVMSFIMIPYMYLVYKWMTNVTYKQYTIQWQTSFWSSIGKIFIEILLSTITLGIYAPFAFVRLYAYFIHRTVAQSDEATRSFGFEPDPFNDFLFLWGQILLTIVTLGVYYPWMICKVSSRFLGRTYLEL